MTGPGEFVLNAITAGGDAPAPKSHAYDVAFELVTANKTNGQHLK